ncbi:hypothetical protein OIU84_022737 [Salix udensis]|uniref:Pectinesterase catalytic domain-containing protein n=1 Tax=Salix udensis TaxID=889485 RepID=A0AAD6PFK4_9ROSI|nr:hypothetical protein OIU84_022737 [Salix udensis]
MVTAQGRTDPNQNTGIVIQKSRIGATSDLLPVKSSFPTYLGRPWKEYSRTVIMQSSITDVINPAGWHEWSGSFALSTLFYAEYQNSGAGAGTSSRVTWAGYKVITSATEAQVFTPGNFIAGSSWLSSTTFPFSLGLPIDKHKNRRPLKADVVVAAEGSGDYSTVSAAVAAAQREAVRGALSESKQVFTGKLCKY